MMSRKLSGKNPAKQQDLIIIHMTTPPLNRGGLRGVLRILEKGWLASREGFAVSLVGLFHHICLTDDNNFYNCWVNQDSAG
jgi:hypothetical protein